MKTLKDRFAPAESKRSLFFQLGVIASCALSLVAFKWTTYETSSSDISKWTGDVEYIMEEEIPVLKPTVPKTSQRRPIYDVFEVVKEKPVFEPEPIIDPNPKKFYDYDPFAFDESDLPGEIPITANKGPVDHWAVERMPYYSDCSDFTNPEAESNCTAAAIVRHINEFLKYPAIAKSAGIEGTVKLMFIINEKGQPTDIEVIRKVHPSLDKEAVRALSLIPSMNPAKQNGHPVSVRYITDVAFRLKKN